MQSNNQIEENTENTECVENVENIKNADSSENNAAEFKAKKRKKCRLIISIALAFVIFVLGVLQAGCIYTRSIWEHWVPNYEKIDIKPLLNKTELDEADYQTLYYQTGLTKLAIDDMWTEEGKKRILKIQDCLFTDYGIETEHFAPFTYMEKIDGFSEVGALQPGDIIVTSTTRVAWWPYGHAALVVNNEERLVVECIGPGVKSEYNSVEDFEYLGDFMVVRPKFDREFREKVAKYAEDNLLGLNYRFSIGVLSKKYKEDITASQCAHLVWYAYKAFGVDLDSDGGGIVKPQDMALSPHVELVQAFGFDLDRLWEKK